MFIKQVLPLLENEIMDLQTRKLNIIEYLLNLQDERLMGIIENTIYQFDDKPFTEEQLVERAKRANQDYALGKFIDQAILEEESKKW